MRHVVDFVAYFTYPPLHGGQLRVHYYNKALSEHMRVTQISFTPVVCFLKVLQHTRNYREIIIWNPVFTLLVVWLKLLGKRSYDHIIPLAFLLYPSFFLRRWCKHADVVQVEHPWLFRYISCIPWLKGRKKILVAHNIEHKLYDDIYHDRRITEKVKRIEHRAVHDADVVFAMSEEDKNILQRWNPHVVVVPHAIGKDQLKRHKVKRWPRKLVVFAGSNHPPNHAAVRFIVDKLASECKDMDFCIVGSVCKERRREGNVIMTGPVSHVGKEKWFSRADVFINPVNSGSGVNIKMLEYMFYGKPIVSTEFGARGVPHARILQIPLSEFSKGVRETLPPARSPARYRDILLISCRYYA